MGTRRFYLTGAVLAVVTLALSLTAAPAQATPNGLYDCQSVHYLDMIINRPVNGFGCTGPVGVAPPGSVYEIPSGEYYGCQQLTGTLWPDGQLWVHGNVCDPF